MAWIKLSKKVNNRWVPIKCEHCGQVMRFSSFKKAKEYETANNPVGNTWRAQRVEE